MSSNRRVISSNWYRPQLVVLSSLSLLMGVTGCTQPTGNVTEETQALPQVVATTSVLCDLTQQIAEDTVDLTCLMEPGQDPHSYAATPSDRRAIEAADLVLYDGYGFAPNLLPLVEASAEGTETIAVYETAVPTPLMADPHDHSHGEDAHAGHEDDHGDHGKEDHDGHTEDAHAGHGEKDHAGHEEDAHGDHEDDAHAGHGEDAHGKEAHGEDKEELVADPHIWHSANNNGTMAEVIASQLQQINPEQAELYVQNADQLMTQFTEIDTWIKQQVATVPAENRKLITTHTAFNYFADAYGFEIEAALSGVGNEESPSAARMAELVDEVKALSIPAIFAESTDNGQLIETLAKNAGVKVADEPLLVEGPGGPGSRAETTQAMLVANTCTVVNALGGTCESAGAPL